MFDFLETYSGALTFLATLILTGITGFYAKWTKGILEATENNHRLSLVPVIGIRVMGINIGKVFGPNRRQMHVKIEIVNLGNAPAIAVNIDAEIELRYSDIENEKSIPTRWGPIIVPFLKSGETQEGLSLGFGNKCLRQFFYEVSEMQRLNRERLEKDPTREAFKVSRLRLITYCHNSLGQYYKSVYETEIDLMRPESGEVIPLKDEEAKVYLVCPRDTKFETGAISLETVQEEACRREPLRKLCGY